jgi:hypothetical protein
MQFMETRAANSQARILRIDPTPPADNPRLAPPQTEPQDATGFSTQRQSHLLQVNRTFSKSIAPSPSQSHLLQVNRTFSKSIAQVNRTFSKSIAPSQSQSHLLQVNRTFSKSIAPSPSQSHLLPKSPQLPAITPPIRSDRQKQLPNQPLPLPHHQPRLLKGQSMKTITRTNTAGSSAGILPAVPHASSLPPADAKTESIPHFQATPKPPRRRGKRQIQPNPTSRKQLRLTSAPFRDRFACFAFISPLVI